MEWMSGGPGDPWAAQGVRTGATLSHSAGFAGLVPEAQALRGLPVQGQPPPRPREWKQPAPRGRVPSKQTLAQNAAMQEKLAQVQAAAAGLLHSGQTGPPERSRSPVKSRDGRRRASSRDRSRSQRRSRSRDRRSRSGRRASSRSRSRHHHTSARSHRSRSRDARSRRRSVSGQRYGGRRQ